MLSSALRPLSKLSRSGFARCRIWWSEGERKRSVGVRFCLCLCLVVLVLVLVLVLDPCSWLRIRRDRGRGRERGRGGWGMRSLDVRYYGRFAYNNYEVTKYRATD